MLVLGHELVAARRLGKELTPSSRSRSQTKSAFAASTVSAVLCMLAVSACSTGVESDPGGDGEDGDTSLSVGSGPDPVACDEVAFQGKSLPPDLLVVVKGSQSAGEGQISDLDLALQGFVESPSNAGVGFALSSFPRISNETKPSDCGACTGAGQTCGGCIGDPHCQEGEDNPDCVPQTCTCTELACNASDYQSWYSAGPFSSDFMTLPTSGVWAYAYAPNVDTAIAPAMSGAVQALTGWALNHHDQNAGIVLVSGSEAAGGPCPASSTSEVATAAADAASSAAAIRTYVITLGSVPALDAVAVSGGSVAAQNTSAPELGAALSTVVQQMRGCAYEIPMPSSGAIDPEKLNVRVQGAAEEDKLAQVPSAADCAAHQGGWYYDDPSDPRKILLCHESCAELGQAGKGVDVLLGCPTVEVPK